MTPAERHEAAMILREYAGTCRLAAGLAPNGELGRHAARQAERSELLAELLYPTED